MCSNSTSMTSLKPLYNSGYNLKSWRISSSFECPYDICTTRITLGSLIMPETIKDFGQSAGTYWVTMRPSGSFLNQGNKERKEENE